ncbi:MAG: type II secretion system F family protein, partial [Myxococcota bacterium]
MAALGRLPVLGGALEKLALERFAWSLGMLLDTELDLRRVAPLALAATGSQRYTRHAEGVVGTLREGEPLSVALQQTGEFPDDLLQTLFVGEQSGRTVETLDRLGKRYEEEADAAIGVLANVFAAVVWLAVAGVLLLLIFRVFGF